MSFFFFFVNGRTIIKIVMAKQEKEERLIRDGRISMFVLGTSRWRGGAIVPARSIESLSIPFSCIVCGNATHISLKGFGT